MINKLEIDWAASFLEYLERSKIIESRVMATNPNDPIRNCVEWRLNTERKEDSSSEQEDSDEAC